MKTKIGISLVLTLLMVASTFTTVNAMQENGSPECPPKGAVDFTKSVWNGEYWADYIEGAQIGDIVRFNISLTYHKHPENHNNWTLYNIVITDTLPECLEFADPLDVTFFNAPEVEGQIVENVITWNFTSCQFALHDDETMTIEFNAVVIQSEETENENIATFTATECGHYSHSGDDNAWVYVYVPPPLEFTKEVYDPETQSWVDVLDGVEKNVPIDFKITITYIGLEGYDLMKCMVVKDYLPECCLEYVPDSEVITYPNEENFESPIITVESLKTITFDWTSKKFNLYKGETITIQFKANVVNYCYYPVDNCAEVDLWSCCPEVHLEGRDCATVNCFPPETTFEKFVWDEKTGTWADYAELDVGQDATYKIVLTYHGNYALNDVRIVDHLPFITEYKSSETEPSYIEDNRTIWWNFTEPVVDGTPLVIIFTAYIWGSTGDCPGCGINYADYTAIESETQTPFSGEDTATIKTDYPGPQEPMIQLEITRAKIISLGKVCATIKNTGEKDVSVDWNITLTAGILKKTYTTKGTIDLLEINLAKTVCTGKSIGKTAMKFRFGKITGTITATAEDYTTSATFSGRIIGRLILVTKWQPVVTPEEE